MKSFWDKVKIIASILSGIGTLFIGITRLKQYIDNRRALKEITKCEDDINWNLPDEKNCYY